MNISLAPLRAARWLALPLLAASAAPAQSIVAPPRPPPAPAASGDASSRSLASISSALASGAPLYQRGPVSVRPHLEYRFLYGDGIEAGPGNQRDTAIHSLSVGSLVEIGDHWFLDYTPTWTYYSNEAFRDTFDQLVALAGNYTFDNWRFTGAQGYESLHAMLVETGRQTKQEKYTTTLGAAYLLGRHARLEASATRSARYANAVADAPEWTTADWLQYSSTEWLRYHVTRRLNFAAGVTFGHADLSVGDDMRFVEPQTQLVWKPTDKVSLSAQAGIERRQFQGGRPPLRTPTHTAAVTYQPFQTTRVSFNASRGVSASYFANEITRSSGWAAGVEQRLLERLYLDASYAERATRFLSTAQVASARRDRYHAINARLSTVLLHRTAFSLVFQTGRNSSDIFIYEFESYQYGCEISHRF